MNINELNTIYLDNQASTPVLPDVLEEMTPYFSNLPANPHSTDHFWGWKANEAVEIARSRIADLINADPSEIFFTSGATEANNLAILGAESLFSESRNKILTTPIEHKCVLAAAEELTKRRKITHKFLPVDQAGQIDADNVARMIENDVALISIILVNNEIGTIQVPTPIAAAAKKAGAIIHYDAAQSPLAIDIDVDKLGADLLSLSAHKIYGPMGIGALYIRSELQSVIQPLQFGGGQEAGIRPGTLPVPLCVGFGAAALHLQKHSTHIREKLIELRGTLLSGLENEITSAQLVGPKLTHRHPSNLNIRFPGVDAPDFLNQLQPRIAASTGSACTSGIIGASHVLRSIGLSESEASECIRFSVGLTNTDDEIESAVKLIAEGLI